MRILVGFLFLNLPLLTNNKNGEQEFSFFLGEGGAALRY